MPTKERYEKYYKKEEDGRSKPVDAVTWLERHPEDIPLARENLYARDHYDSDAMKNLMAAVCLRACTDYKLATNGVRLSKSDTKKPAHTIQECREFFEGDIFQLFINRIRVDEVEKMIRATPDGSLNSLVKNLK